jgi:hypothetical protein
MLIRPSYANTPSFALNGSSSKRFRPCSTAAPPSSKASRSICRCPSGIANASIGTKPSASDTHQIACAAKKPASSEAVIIWFSID